MRTVIQGSGRSLEEHAAPLRADRLRVVDHPAFVAEQAAREAAGGRPQGPERHLLAAPNGSLRPLYNDEHLPQAIAALHPIRAWRGWSEVDPLIHYAAYEF